MVTSDDFIDNLGETEMVAVESEKILKLVFTHFEVTTCGSSACPCDYVKITDRDGTSLMDKSCGFSSLPTTDLHYFKPPIIATKTNSVEILFHIFSFNAPIFGRSYGWRASWIAVTPGGSYVTVQLSRRCPEQQISGLV